MKLSLILTAACLGVSVTYGDMAEKIRKPLSKLFTGLDKDAGGSLTVDEFSRLQGGKKYGKILSEKTLVAFAKADADHDQSISEEEFHAYQTNPHLEIYADKIAAFVRADRNHDAALNAKELAFTAKPKLKKSAAAALLAAKDQNADGLLSFTELHGELPKDKSIIGSKVKDLQAILGTAYDAYAKDFLIINNGVVVDVTLPVVITTTATSIVADAVSASSSASQPEDMKNSAGAIFSIADTVTVNNADNFHDMINVFANSSLQTDDIIISGKLPLQNFTMLNVATDPVATYSPLGDLIVGDLNIGDNSHASGAITTSGTQISTGTLLVTGSLGSYSYNPNVLNVEFLDTSLQTIIGGILPLENITRYDFTTNIPSIALMLGDITDESFYKALSNDEIYIAPGLSVMTHITIDFWSQSNPASIFTAEPDLTPDSQILLDAFNVQVGNSEN